MINRMELEKKGLLLLFLLTKFLRFDTSETESGFTYCQTREVNRIVDTSPECKHPYTIKKKSSLNDDHSFLLPVTNNLMFNVAASKNVYILSKNQYYLNTVGYQCFKSIRTTWLNRTWYLVTSRSEQTRIVQATSAECRLMIHGKMCGLNRINECNENGCWYRVEAQDEYFYNVNRKVEDIQCSFVKKHILAEMANSTLYFAALNDCKPADLECKLRDSIVVWERKSDSPCLYSTIHKGLNYTVNTLNPDIIQSGDDKLAFQLTGETHICSDDNGNKSATIRAYTTTSDLLIVLEADTASAERVARLAKSTANATIWNHGHDIANMMLAERDGDKAEAYENQIQSLELDVYHRCRLLAQSLQLVAKDDNQLTKVTDIMGRQVTVYTLRGIIYLPFCSNVNSIRVRNDTNKCYNDLPITYQVESARASGDRANNTQIFNYTKQGFLTKTNFIRDDSYEIDCDMVNHNQVLPCKKSMLVRRGNKAAIFPIGHMIVGDLTSTSYQMLELNFYHHKEIIQNYQSNELVYEMFEQESDSNDIAGGFYSMPNDRHLSKDEYHSDTKQTVQELIKFKNRVDTSIKILATTFGFLVAFLVLYFVFRFACLIASFMRSLKNERKVTSRTRHAKDEESIPLAPLSITCSQ